MKLFEELKPNDTVFIQHFNTLTNPDMTLIETLLALVFFVLAIAIHCAGDGSIDCKLDEIQFLIAGLSFAIFAELDRIKSKLDSKNKQ